MSAPHAKTLPIGHIGLTVPDLDAAVDWYCSVLGWELLMGPLTLSTADDLLADQLRDVFRTQDVAFRQAHIRAGNDVVIELFQFLSPEPTTGHAEFAYVSTGVFHFCVLTSAVEEVVARIAEAGGKQRSAVRAMFPDQPFLMCYCEDPFGNVIEVATPLPAETFRARRGYLS